MSPRFVRTSRRRSVVFGVAIGVLLLATSCDDGAAPGDDDALPTRRYQFDPDLAPEVTSGLAVAEVVAQGDGCPPGSWFTELERDGKSFRVRLVGYETGVEDGLAASTRSCKLSIKLRSRVPVAFALRSIAYIGYAMLDEGVQARFDTQSYFDQETPDGPVNTLQLRGPYESEFVEQAQVDVPSWSACGVERDVHVQTTIGVQNATPPGIGIGFISIGEAHGALPTAVDTARFGITFAVRTCDDPVDASASAPVTAVDAGPDNTTLPADTLLGGLDSGVPNTERAAPDTK